MAIEQNEPIQGNTGLPGRTVANFLADLQNLRNWWHRPVGASGVVNPPKQFSPLYWMLRAAQESANAQAQGRSSLTADEIVAAIPAQRAHEVAEKLRRS
jgi:hypothetical protein